MLLAILFALSMNAQEDPTGKQIMINADERPTGEDQIGMTTMTLTNKRGQTKVRKIHRAIRDYEDQTRTIVIFLEPADVKGSSLLMWDYDDDDKDADQWLYLPAVGKVKRIASAEKGDNFMGSDFTYRDMEGRDPADYDQTVAGKELYDGDSCWVIESIPREGIDDDYIRVKSWIADSTWVMRKAEFYDKKDELRKELSTYNVELIDDIWTVKKMVMKDVKKEHQTEIVVEDVEYNSNVPEENFTKRALQRGEIVR